MKTDKVIFKYSPSRLANLAAYAGVGLWLIAAVVSTIPFWPFVWYRLQPQTSQQLASVLAQKALTGDAVQLATKVREPYRPPFDPNLPQENLIRIPKIGVDTAILEGQEPYAVLEKGVWRVPEFSTPEKQGIPMIVAAHRFGYLTWSQQYRTRNSFFNLPKLKNGDSVEVIWDQRKYIYQITVSYEGETIDSYDTDLILYTCKLFNSPLRIFYYAKLQTA